MLGMREAHRVLRSEGLFVAGTISRWTPQSWRRSGSERLHRLIGR